MKFIYCPKCGTKLETKEIGDEGALPYCVPCHKPYFDLFGQCVIVAIVDETGEVLLAKQNFGSVTSWALVAGYIKKGESAEETAIREVREETGQTAVALRYIQSYYYAKKELLMYGFVVFVNQQALQASIEVEELQWFSMADAIQTVREGSIAQQHLQNTRNLITNAARESFGVGIDHPAKI